MNFSLHHCVRRVFALSLLGGLIAAATLAWPAQADEIASPVTVAPGTTTTITADTTLTSTIVVQAGGQLVVAPGAKLTIAAAATLTVEGPAAPTSHEVEINGTVENKGNLILGGHLLNNGQLYNSGWFSVLENGAYTNPGPGLFDDETAGTTQMAGTWDDLGRFFHSGTWQIPPDGHTGTMVQDETTGAIYHVKSRLVVEPVEAVTAGCAATAVNTSESLPPRYAAYAGHGQTLALTATTCPGWVFDHWSHNDLTGRPEVIQPPNSPTANWTHAVHSMVSPTALAVFVPATEPTTEPTDDPNLNTPPQPTDVATSSQPTTTPGLAASPSRSTLPLTGTSASTWPNTMLALALVVGGVIVSAGGRHIARTRYAGR